MAIRHSYSLSDFSQIKYIPAYIHGQNIITISHALHLQAMAIFTNN